MCFDSANLQGTGAARKWAGDKGTGSGRVRYGRREVLTPLSPPTHSGTQRASQQTWPRLI